MSVTGRRSRVEFDGKESENAIDGHSKKARLENQEKSIKMDECRVTFSSQQPVESSNIFQWEATLKHCDESDDYDLCAATKSAVLAKARFSKLEVSTLSDYRDDLGDAVDSERDGCFNDVLFFGEHRSPRRFSWIRLRTVFSPTGHR